VIDRIEQGLLRRADQIGVISPEFVSQLTDRGVQPDRISVVPNFTHIDPVDVTTQQARSILGWNPEVFTVVHTGNMGLKQGLLQVVESARQAEDRGDQINWVLVGDGNQRRNLEASARRLRSVRFIDPLAEDLYPYALAAADVLLLNESPGVKEFCLPSKLTSYVVAARPILAATQPGSITYRTIDQHGFAHLVPAGDPAALLAGLARIRAEPELAQHLVRSALRYAPQTSRDAAAARYVEFVERLATLS
jgi:glycosyltransferase involved in cell wall biosynthesis